MLDRSVLIVDNDEDYRDYLVSQMRAEGAAVVGVGSGEEAVRLLREDPRRFQFAVVDQYLQSGMDGIATTKELVDLNSGLFVVVFTNVPSDNPEDIARFRYESLRAGAYRYLERVSAEGDKRAIGVFVREMEQLTNLRAWIREFYETRVTVLPSLLTQLDIGVDIIDRSYKVWYLNGAMRCILRMPEKVLPREPCSAWHHYRFAPCPGCLVCHTFGEGSDGDKYFLLPLPDREKGRLFYLHIWTQPIRDANGKLLLAADGHPLAVMESVQDLTDSAQLLEMPFEDRLQLIAEALHWCPEAGRYTPVYGFAKTRVYLRDRENADNFVLKAAAGFDLVKLGAITINSITPASTFDHLPDAEANVRASGYGYCVVGGHGRDPLLPDAPPQSFIYWPIIEDGRTVALLEASGPGCSPKTVELLRPYAEELRAALQAAVYAGFAVAAEAEQLLADVDLKLQTAASVLEGLRVLVRECSRLTNSHIAFLRYRDQEDAVLVRLDLSEYERVAEPREPLSQLTSFSARTIISGLEHIASMSDQADVIQRGREHLSELERGALADTHSLCFLPLRMESRCIGALGLHSTSLDNYDDAKIALARLFAGRIALALHDYLVEQTAREKLAQARDETISLILHNIYNPLDTIRTAADMLRQDAARGVIDAKAVQEHARVIDSQAERIARVRDAYLKLQKPWESRTEVFDAHALITDTAREWTERHAGVSLRFELDDSIRSVRADLPAVGVCLGVLLQNSLDALEGSKRKGEIVVRLRRASTEEANRTSTLDPVLAIDVSDNGSGVPAAIRPDLFKVIKSGNAKGLGFGLSYCRHIVQSARGDVYYHAADDTGAKFTVLLPFSQARQDGKE
jgi:nitrogen-specific signal transduction histidine kinase/CheY-like chemotaxis protein